MEEVNQKAMWVSARFRSKNSGTSPADPSCKLCGDPTAPADPSCKLCGDPTEDASHFISCCSALESERVCPCFFKNIIFFIITSYLGSELKERALESLSNSPSQSFTATYCLHTQYCLDFAYLPVCTSYNCGCKQVYLLNLKIQFWGGHLQVSKYFSAYFHCLCLNWICCCVCPQSLCSIFAHSLTGSTAFFNAYFGRGTGHILLDDLLCNGSETRLIDCPRYTGQGIGTYDYCQNGHGEDAGVRCMPRK